MTDKVKNIISFGDANNPTPYDSDTRDKFLLIIEPESDNFNRNFNAIDLENLIVSFGFNFVSQTDPTQSNNKFSNGVLYPVGSNWINTSANPTRSFILVNNSESGAIWQKRLVTASGIMDGDPTTTQNEPTEYMSSNELLTNKYLMDFRNNLFSKHLIGIKNAYRVSNTKISIDKIRLVTSDGSINGEVDFPTAGAIICSDGAQLNLDTDGFTLSQNGSYLVCYVKVNNNYVWKMYEESQINNLFTDSNVVIPIFIVQLLDGKLNVIFNGALSIGNLTISNYKISSIVMEATGQNMDIRRWTNLSGHPTVKQLTTVINGVTYRIPLTQSDHFPALCHSSCHGSCHGSCRSMN